MSLGPGSTIGPFKIQSLLGKGGMGEVFAALDTRLDRKVALKILPADFAADTDRLRRFQSEAKTLASLNHPNILVIHEVGAENGHPFLVSELLEGRTLRDELNSISGPLPLRKSVEFGVQIANGLAAAHARGIIHRDLKPENIFITKDGHVKILDFGLAKNQPIAGVVGADVRRLTSSDAPDQSEPPHVGSYNESAATLLDSTVPGLVLGTPAYMSPEQVRGEAADHRSDVFAFGCVLYEMLSGRRAFAGDSAVAMMNAVLQNDPPEVPVSSPVLARLIHRCLEKDPSRRFQSASDLAFALESIAGWTPSDVANRRASGRSRVGVASVGLGLLALLVGAGFLFATRPSSHPTSRPRAWRGEQLAGPPTAFFPQISADGKELAFEAIVDGQSQVGLMNIDSGFWKILTTNRNLGMVDGLAWSIDATEIFYGRSAGENDYGIFRVSKYGGEERLVVPKGFCRGVTSSGALLVGLPLDTVAEQLALYFPETEQVRRLDAVAEATLVNRVVALPNEKILFLGRLTNSPPTTRDLWLLDLKSGLTEPFLAKLAKSGSHRSLPLAFAAAPGSSQILFSDSAGQLHRISLTALDDLSEPRPIFTLTQFSMNLSLDNSGQVFADQGERPNEIIRARADGSLEKIPLPSSTTVQHKPVLPLPGNRFLFPADDDAFGRLMLIAPGTESRPWLETKTDCGPPFARLGPDRVLFTAREGSKLTIRSASLAGRNVKSHLEVSWPLKTPANSAGMAGSPDGQTIYFAENGFINAVPSSGGAVKRLCRGNSVAVDPHGRFLVAKVFAPQNSLLRYSLADGAEERIATPETFPLSFSPIASNAIAQDGRILVRVAPVNNWFWPMGILNPASGEIKLATDEQADMSSGGWDDEGRLVASALYFRSTLWRFRPEEDFSK